MYLPRALDEILLRPFPRKAGVNHGQDSEELELLHRYG